MVTHPFSRAFMIPARMLGELPLVLIPIATSPAEANPSIWRENTASNE
jgi:hypothetical protein